MTIRFIPASELKKHYEVRGHFYSLGVPGADPVPCRSVLEIKSSDLPSSNAADAVFVMMNPGSSRPLFEIEHQTDVDRVGAMTRPLVPTKPDTTQYQVMRVMREAGWMYVRVLNLSDLRDANSGSFAQRFPQLEQATGTSVHSIFAPERSDELTAQLRRKLHAPVVCAWGVNDKLDPLIARATTRLAPTGDVIGLAKPGHPGKFFHPLPSPQTRKEEWVVQMLAMLRRKQVSAI